MRKPKILLCSDVKNWAWAKKCTEIQTHLSDEFHIEIIHLLETRTGIRQGDFDLYLTFGWSYVSHTRLAPRNRCISGMTAHKGKGFLTTNIIPAMKKVDWHHANSILLKNELEKYDIENVFYVPNGVNEDIFRPVVPIKPQRSNLVALHVGKKCGHESDVKGQKRFIEPSCEQAGIKYIGHYNNYKTALTTQEMVSLYQQADVFLVSSETDGTPCGALEAAACGRPIISNAIGNMPEFIKDGYNGFLVPRVVDAYVEKLKYLKENRDKLIEMGNNARKTVEEGWTWKIQAENYRKMFQTILNKVGLREGVK